MARKKSTKLKVQKAEPAAPMPSYRQGDVILKPIASLPNDPKGEKVVQRALTDPRGYILAYGEVTGHHHSFAPQAAVQVFDNGSGGQYVSVMEPSTLVHQEHQPFTVEKGLYKVIIQRESDLQQTARQVRD